MKNRAWYVRPRRSWVHFDPWAPFEPYDFSRRIRSSPLQSERTATDPAVKKELEQKALEPAETQSAKSEDVKRNRRFGPVTDEIAKIVCDCHPEIIRACEGRRWKHAAAKLVGPLMPDPPRTELEVNNLATAIQRFWDKNK